MLTLERPPERLLLIPDVAARLNVPEGTVRRWLRQGKLAGHRFGGTKTGWRISEQDLARFLAATRYEGDPKAQE